MKPLCTIYHFDLLEEIPEDRASIIRAYSEQLQATPQAVGNVGIDRHPAAQAKEWMPPVEELYWTLHTWRDQQLITLFHFLLGAKIIAVQLGMQRSYYLDGKHPFLSEPWLSQVLDKLMTEATHTQIPNQKH